MADKCSTLPLARTAAAGTLFRTWGFESPFYFIGCYEVLENESSLVKGTFKTIPTSMNSNRQRLKFGLGQSCKSTNSNIPFKVTFRNLTDREVLLYWIDYQGKPKFYGLLRKTKAIGEGLAIDTFVTHPWIAIDKTKLEVLSINFSHVLRPVTKRDFVKEEQKIDRLRVRLL